ncbi:class I SAM-dependent methyltransferase [Phenylobacterium sp.]|uniref:class I SAM-dependent methyltransferase n=1 Tax=Phenylobacterium sp. TaxID=1871053 RepID=UPI0025D586EC|nr:class I SAM-dependent methyltransferase [Phenylobacterium sp.]
MASISDAFAGHLRHPRGGWGRLVGQLMRVVNAEPNAQAIRALDVRTHHDVLELGFGPGEGVRGLARLASGGTVFGVDQSSAMLAQAEARNRAAIAAGRVRLSLGSFEATGLADRSVDRILAVNVAYFWSDPHAVLAELDRVLRPGGRISVYATDASAMARWGFIGAGHHRTFDAQGLAAALAAGPFPADAVRVSSVRLRGGVPGLVGVVEKAA